MAATDKVFAGSIPEIYDRLLVPLIFQPYALDLADRVALAQRFGTGAIEGRIRAFVITAAR